MSEPEKDSMWPVRTLPAPFSVKAIVQRHITDDETVSFEGTYAGDDEARLAVSNQLALCRDHMRRYNEEVFLVQRQKADELDEALRMKGEELKRLDAQIEKWRETGRKFGKAIGMAKPDVEAALAGHSASNGDV